MKCSKCKSENIDIIRKATPEMPGLGCCVDCGSFIREHLVEMYDVDGFMCYGYLGLESKDKDKFEMQTYAQQFLI